MSEHQINRRKLLKTVGATSGLALAGRVRASETGYGPVRLVEVGVEYNLPERDDYRRTNVDGDPRYFVDSRRERIVLTTPFPDSVERVFDANEHVVGSTDVAAAPTSHGPEFGTRDYYRNQPATTANRDHPARRATSTAASRNPTRPA